MFVRFGHIRCAKSDTKSVHGHQASDPLVCVYPIGPPVDFSDPSACQPSFDKLARPDHRCNNDQHPILFSDRPFLDIWDTPINIFSWADFLRTAKTLFLSACSGVGASSQQAAVSTTVTAEPDRRLSNSHLTEREKRGHLHSQCSHGMQYAHQPCRRHSGLTANLIIRAGS